jgi:hypothetical protein
MAWPACGQSQRLDKKAILVSIVENSALPAGGHRRADPTVHSPANNEQSDGIRRTNVDSRIKGGHKA